MVASALSVYLFIFFGWFCSPLVVVLVDGFRPSCLPVFSPLGGTWREPTKCLTWNQCLLLIQLISHLILGINITVISQDQYHHSIENLTLWYFLLHFWVSGRLRCHTKSIFTVFYLLVTPQRMVLLLHSNFVPKDCGLASHGLITWCDR